MAHPVRRILATLPGLLALSVYLVLAAGPMAPVDAEVDTGLSNGHSTGHSTGQHRSP